MPAQAPRPATGLLCEASPAKPRTNKSNRHCPRTHARGGKQPSIRKMLNVVSNVREPRPAQYLRRPSSPRLLVALFDRDGNSHNGPNQPLARGDRCQRLKSSPLINLVIFPDAAFSHCENRSFGGATWWLRRVGSAKPPGSKRFDAWPPSTFSVRYP